MSNQAGKGSAYRKCDPKKMSSNHDTIFGKKEMWWEKRDKEKETTDANRNVR
jgi:hypothetical protein